MLVRGLLPNKEICNSLTMGYCKQEKYEHALGIFQLMSENGSEPTLIYYWR